MTLTIRILGCEVLHVSTKDQADEPQRGDATAYPVTPDEVADDIDNFGRFALTAPLEDKAERPGGGDA